MEQRRTSRERDYREKENTDEVRQAIILAASYAVKLIASSAADAVRGIADAAGQARMVVAANASEAAKILNARNADVGSDHDLLTRLDVKVDGLGTQIKDLSSGTAQRIYALEHDKLDAKDSYPLVYKQSVDAEFADHEKRIRDAEDKTKKVMAYGATCIFILGVAEALLNLLHK